MTVPCGVLCIISYVFPVYNMYMVSANNVCIFLCIIASEASFLVCSMARIFYIYICIFQAVRRAVNVLNVSTCI